MADSSSFLLQDSMTRASALGLTAVALANAACEPGQTLMSEPVAPVSYDPADSILDHYGIILAASLIVGGLVIGANCLLRRVGRYQGPTPGLRIRRVEDFDEMKRFLALSPNDPSLPDRIKIRSFKGMAAAGHYLHVMATRGPGIAMTSTSIGFLGFNGFPRSPEEVAGYSLQLYVGDLAVDETLPASSGPLIKKLHLGAAQVYRETESIHKTIRWLEKAVEKIRKS